MLTTIDDIVGRVQIHMGTSAALLTEEGYQASAEGALGELGYSLPLSDSFKENWVIKRAKRHSLFILYIESANRFQYKQIHLNHRFNHYDKIVQAMDKEFEKAMDDNWLDFVDANPFEIFGTKIAAGFSYDTMGRDRTYDFANYVRLEP